jgi:NTE family protein
MRRLEHSKIIQAPKKVAFALQGGGTHGAFTWGVLDYILEDGRLEIEGLSGTSAGAMNATALLQGLLKDGPGGARRELRRFWECIQNQSYLSPLKPTFYNYFMGKPKLCNTPAYIMLNLLSDVFSPYESNPFGFNPLKSILEEFFDFNALHQAKTPKLFLSATHIATGKSKIFTEKDIKIESLLASACLPFIFQAIEVDGEFYWDGGFMSNPPLHPLIHNCETHNIIVIQLTQALREKLPTTSQEIIDRHKEITFNSCLVHEIRAIDFISKLVDRGMIKDKSVKSTHIHVIRNAQVFEQLELSSVLNADPAFLKFLFEAGRATACDWLEEHFNDIGVKTTADLDKDFVV